MIPIVNRAERAGKPYNVVMTKSTEQAGANIEGLSHLTFVVRDLQRAAYFFCEGLGAQEVYDSSARNFSISREKFFLLGGLWIACMEGEPSGTNSYRHVAFKVAETDIPHFEARLHSLGVTFKPARNRIEGEGLSLYFYDFDGHLFELHTGTLEQRLASYQDATSSISTTTP